MALIIFLVIALTMFSVHGQEKSRALEAASVARTKFISDLGKLKKTDWEWQEYISNADNYNIGISENKGNYVVVFSPREKGIRGGVYEYWIRRSDLKVVRFRGYE
ncbi:hypothetical protein [Lysobacter gummosus]|uniref:Transmembrane protein n=1 Tax=Lysobacter gummosus TaxID=262324 RepID=A0ABY3XG50_9GAMM|nr:hypothetical protein [Lysobacter gummosus]UNP30615.1 hypothetical protein MOV92_04945 [Lysobacter gummosus]